jgi:ABC-type multidrug transport system ATPase subunit
LTKQKLGAETAYVEQVAQADQTEVLSDFARKGYNLVFAHGGQFDAAIEQVAPQFPNTFFIAVNGAVKGENIAAVRIDHLQASYLCGIIAASITKSNKIAYIAGQEFEATQQELRGLELGAKSVKPNIQITPTFTGDWNDVAKGKEATLALISSGADVIYQWLDNASATVLQTASDQGVYAFGNTKDQLEIALPGKLVLSVQGLQVADDRGIIAVRNVSFDLRAGEILGIAGVDGNGQRELADAIARIRSIKRGKIEFANPSLKKVKEIVGYIPEDRQKMGLVLQFSIAQNLILKAFKKIPFCRRFLLQPEIINNNAKSAMQEFDIRAGGIDVKVSQLSGGNQQKVVLARELAGEPLLIVAMQPTRGLDVGATQAVQRRLIAQRERGAAILYISTELEEVMAMSDRIAVMYRGEFVDILDTQRTTIEEIGLLMGRGRGKVKDEG